MGTIRFRALDLTMQRQEVEVNYPGKKIADYYGEMVFDKRKMQEYLPKDIYKSLVKAIDSGEKIDRKVADLVAAAMRAWASEKGVTHFTHWFQPLTGDTAEKHDAFFSSVDNNRAIENFQGDDLVQQEPDASSFPSGGIRSTFEARGYTAWDPSSPAFIMNNTLCIPSIFVSFTGEALDYKTPLLKALAALDKAATDVCKFFDRNVNKVVATLGIEQEYFLVDSALFNARPDLVLTGRTLFGHSSAKDQQLEDNYFGAIPQRVLNFMKDFEIEAYKLGIPLHTRHNEIAPNQFECAPLFEEVNLAIDHNQILMDLIEKTAEKHHFVALMHEKPYAGVNGSGKHNNWSLMTNTKVNLLSPGKTPKANLSFLVFLANIIKAVHENSLLLRASIASASNDLRLGANEAPPAIISVFIGKQLTETIDSILKSKSLESLKNNSDKELYLSIPKIPEILLDNTDRNRTSPFAFTGNKFEFRAVGSSANCGRAMITLNTILANQLIEFKKEVDSLIKKGIKQNDAVFDVVRKYIRESKNILFEGNNYSEEWQKEAEKRGLPNVKSTPEALKSYIDKKSLTIFERMNVISEREMHARYEIQNENYTKKIQIESRVTGDLASNHIIPTVIKYQNILIENVKGLKEILDNKTFTEVSAYQVRTLKEISHHISEIRKMVEDMTEARKYCNNLHEADEKAMEYHNRVLPFISSIRNHVDKLEMLVDDELWPLPKYRELLFTK